MIIEIFYNCKYKFRLLLLIKKAKDEKLSNIDKNLFIKRFAFKVLSDYLQILLTNQGRNNKRYS